MFKRILVPLDRSTRAEHALPVAARLARAAGGTLILVEISNTHLEYGPYRDPGSGFAPLIIDRDDREVTEYLRTIAHSPLLADLATETVVASGQVATTILELAQTHAADLLVMVSHGRTGLARWILGSMTQQVARHAVIPVLALSDDGPSPADIALGAVRPLRVLVPLDGSPLAETALAPTLELVRSLVSPTGGEIHLLRVVDAAVMHNETTGKALDLSAEEITPFTAHIHFDEARAYLAQVVASLQNQMAGETSPMITSSVVANYDAAGAIIAKAERTQARSDRGGEGPFDVIALATHGRSGLERWALGSVMERVLEKTHLPLCIVHAAGPSTHQATAAHQATVESHPPIEVPFF